MKLSIVLLLAALTGLYTFFERQDARYEKALLSTMEPNGCHNEHRGLSFNAAGGIILFERFCGQEVRRTMNASFIPNQRPDSEPLLPRGPGNVLVLDLPKRHGRRAFVAGMDADYVSPGRMAIRYDSTAHVISQNPSVGGVTFELVPTALP